MTQWLRICLPVQGTWVRARVREDPTCRRATKPVCHNYWACALEPTSHNYWARVPQLLKPTHLEPALHKRSLRTATKSSTPLATTRESLRTATKTQGSQKKKKLNKLSVKLNLLNSHGREHLPKAWKTKVVILLCFIWLQGTLLE